jgi:hypothetical protein
LLLDRYAPSWHQELKAGDSFDVLLRNALHIALPANVEQVAARQATQYDGVALYAAETVRAAKRQQVIARYRAKFVDGPILRLQLRHMHVEFNPRNPQPLGDAGTIYPNLRISDDWGVLEANEGALMKSDWSAVVVTAPEFVSGSSIKGDGWTLNLKLGWKIVSGTRKGDFTLELGS